MPNSVIAKLISHKVASGTSAAGKAWTRHDLLTETTDQYPKKILFVCLGDLPLQVAEGMFYNFTFNIESREWQDRNGTSRWSTDAKIVNIEFAPSANAPVEPQATETTTQQRVMGNTEQPQYTQEKLDQMANKYFDQQPTPANAMPQTSSDLPF